MKIKALLLGLLIAGATAVTYTAQDSNADYASKKIENPCRKTPGGYHYETNVTKKTILSQDVETLLKK